MRIYEVNFEQYYGGRWNRNEFSRRVAVKGAAKEAIQKAERLERRVSPRTRVRVESVELLAQGT